MSRQPTTGRTFRERIQPITSTNRGQFCTSIARQTHRSERYSVVHNFPLVVLKFDNFPAGEVVDEVEDGKAEPYYKPHYGQAEVQLPHEINQH